VLILSSPMDLTITYMILVHKRTILNLDGLVMSHVLIVVIVSHVGQIFLLKCSTPTLSQDTWMVHVFSVVVHVPLGQVVRCKGLWKNLLVAWLSAEFLRFISLTLTPSHRSFIVLCRWWSEAWRTHGSWISIAHNTWPETRNSSSASLPYHTKSMWLLGMTRRVSARYQRHQGKWVFHLEWYRSCRYVEI
jgi:hypothetical protein